ncbi:MAG: sulfotransferase [Moorea sp. SIO2B7]|nr:sulfotransferase [Moorena sp. SIO2B7]
MSTNQEDTQKIGALFGAGRSGTTWLGAIISSHPEVVYRFEPFHRRNKMKVEISNAYDLLHSDVFSSKDLASIYTALLPAYPEIEKSPFFSKNYRTNISWGKSYIFPLARKNYLVSHLFRYLYTPKDSPMLVFKEVEMVNEFIQLLTRTEMPIVYLVRHPCGVVSSVMQGQKQSLMPTGRRSVLKSLLTKYNPILADQYGTRLDELTISEQEALLWLLDVGRALGTCQANPNALVVIYEKLVENTLEVTQKVFSHFGLTMAQESISFIEKSTSQSLKSQIKGGELGVNKYFTVYRDSKVSRDRWKKEMSEEDQKLVMKIVKNTEVFAIGAEQGLWM